MNNIIKVVLQSLILAFLSCNNIEEKQYSKNEILNNASKFIAQNSENQLFYDGWLENYKEVYDYSLQLKDSNYTDDVYNFKVFSKWNSEDVKLGFISKQLSYFSENDNNEINDEYINNNSIQTYIILKQTIWNKHYNNSIINNGILPYKIYNEKPSFWRENVLKDFDLIKDSIYKIKDPLKAAFYISENIRKTWKHSYAFKRMNLVTPYHWLHKYKIGICEHRLMYTTFVTRGFGIATYIDFCPHWGNRDGGHSWVSIVDTNKNTIAMNIAEDSILPSKNEVPFRTETGRKTPKVFRRTFEKQSYCLTNYAQKSELIKSSFLNSKNILDVSKEYFKTNNIKISIPKKLYNKYKVAYLCVFDNENWVAIDWSKIENSKIIFENIGRDIVYLPMVFDGELIPLASPFLLDTNGTIHSFTIKNGSHTIQLTRKYPLFPRIEMFYKSLIGGKFQGANKEDFSDFEDLYQINTCPKDGFTNIDIPNFKEFKYVRYKGGKNNSYISEIVFFNINGDTIKGIPLSSKSTEFNDVNSAFDNDFLNYFEVLGASESWVGIKLVKKQIIKKISFMPRTDANFIYQKNYKTYYWNKQWVELPNIVQNGKLIISNAPNNALYFVRQIDLEYNRWDGKEQRIFSYNNGVLNWW